MESKKSHKKEDAGHEEEKTLQELVLNCPMNKYDLILLARRWAHELKTREGETRVLQELIPLAVREILTSKVSAKSIQSLPPLRSAKKTKEAVAAAVLSALQSTSEPAEKETKGKSSSKD